jgi:hypothetical protein
MIEIAKSPSGDGIRRDAGARCGGSLHQRYAGADNCVIAEEELGIDFGQARMGPQGGSDRI